MESAGKGTVVIILGLVAVLVAIAYRPACQDIPHWSYLCLAPWLPVMIPLIVGGVVAIIYGTRILLRL